MKAMPYLSQVSVDPPAEAIKCVIIYENSAAGKAARQFFERLDAEAGGNCASSANFGTSACWGSGIRNEAGRAALAADSSFSRFRMRAAPRKVKDGSIFGSG